MSKPEPAPMTTPWGRFIAATKQILSVSKDELQRREAAYRKERTRKRKRPK